MIEVRVRPFGAFRDYSAEAPIAVQLPQGSGLPELRAALIGRLSELRPDLDAAGLVRDSAFADEAQVILGAADRIDRPCTLFALPPVCGG